MNDGHEDTTYRTEFVSVLNEALHTEEIRRELRRAEGGAGEPGGPAVELLRARAMAAANELAAVAADEYRRYAALRDGLTGPGAQPRDGRGPGVSATLAVLVPMLSGIAAVAFLALGFGLRAAGDGHRVTASLIAVGFTMAAVFGAALTVGLAGLVLTARRDAETARAALEVATAKAAWRRVLLREGVLPYLRQCVAEARPAAPTGVSLVRKRPRLGYSSPGFPSSGGVSLVRQRPKLGYTSPGFSSPSSEPDAPR